MQAAQGDKSELDFKLDICARGCGGGRLPADAGMMEEDKDEKRKIQFSVPSSVPVQLDPRQVEMVRKRDVAHTDNNSVCIMRRSDLCLLGNTL